jgi:hypothetical protein
MATYGSNQIAVLGDIVQHVGGRVGFVHQLDPFPTGVSVDFFVVVGSNDINNSTRGVALFAGPVAIATTPYTDIASNFTLLYPRR